MKNKKFSIKLKMLMTKSGLNAEKLSLALTCSKASVSSWRCGQSHPSKKMRSKIAKFFNVSEEYLEFAEPLECEITCSNSREMGLRGEIESYLRKVLDEAALHNGGLEHFYLDLQMRFPLEIYSGLQFPQNTNL